MRKSTKDYIEKNLRHRDNGKTIDLSHEEMKLSDYQWLGSVLEQSSFIETVKFPFINEGLINKVLMILESATRKNSTVKYLIFHPLTLKIEMLALAKHILQVIINSRLVRNRQEIFAIHGGGNIGLGLMADIVSKSGLGYQIQATSNNKFNRDLINASNQVWLHHGHKKSQTCVNDVTMVSRNTKDIVNLYKDCCLAAICVTPSAMNDMAPQVAQALIERYETDGSGLRILVLMNLPNCHEFVRDKIAEAILHITKNQQYTDTVLSGIDFVPTVIDRIVSAYETENIKAFLKHQLSQQAVTGNVDTIIQTPSLLAKYIKNMKLHAPLFKAETNFSMHVPTSCPEAYRFPAINLTKNIEQIEVIKNKYINGPHAIIAWLGALQGYETIAEAISDDRIYEFISKMMDDEIAPILIAEYPDLTKEELKKLALNFFDRCKASAEDTVVRVGRDPLRKLDSGARIRGTLEIAKKNGLVLATPRIECGIAAGILYAIYKHDPENPCCQKINEIYQNSHQSFSAVLCYHGSAPSGEFTGLTIQGDNKLIKNVLLKISDLRAGRILSPLRSSNTRHGTLGLFPAQTEKARHSSITHHERKPSRPTLLS